MGKGSGTAAVIINMFHDFGINNRKPQAIFFFNVLEVLTLKLLVQ
jgi:hypothetical protein